MALRILLDVDGVLANWNQAVREKFGIDYDEPTEFSGVHKLVGMTASDFWDALLKDYQFWKNIPVRKEAHAIMETCLGFTDEVYISTSVFSGHAMAGRYDWLALHFPEITHISNRAFMFGPHKDLMANDQTILIDDHGLNVDKFRKAGGYGIRYPQPWNDAPPTEDKVEYLACMLNHIKEVING